MKHKFMLLFAAALVCCSLPLVLTSCDDDEPDEKVTAIATYTVDFGKDFFKAGRVIIRYKTADNGSNWETVESGTRWTKTITTTKFPAQLGFSIEVTENDNVTLNPEDTYDITLKGSISATTSKGASFSNNKDFISDAQGSSVLGSKVSSLIKDHNVNIYGYILNKDGNAYQTASLSF